MQYFDVNTGTVNFPYNNKTWAISAEVLQDQYGCQTSNNVDLCSTFEINRESIESMAQCKIDANSNTETLITTKDYQ